MLDYEFLETKKIFKLEDVNMESQNIFTSKSMLQRFLKNNKILRVRQNMYCFKRNIPDKYEIGSQINEKSYISYHSALEYYGLNNQEFFEVYVSSEHKFNKFDFKGNTYKRINCINNIGVMIPKENKLIKITDLEKTIVDCIDRIDLAGGLEELIQCLKSIVLLDTEKVLEYLSVYDKGVLYLKVGYFFSTFLKYVNSDFLIKQCGKYKKNKKYYIETTNKEKYNISSKEWNLILPEMIKRYI